jgi:hypothetical protein
MAVLPTYWWSRDFPGQKAQVRAVRAWIEGLLPACDAREDLVTIASELGTNAVTHTRSGQAEGRFTVDVTWSPERTRVVAGDQGSDEVPGSPGQDQAACAETGCPPKRVRSNLLFSKGVFSGCCDGPQDPRGHLQGKRNR